MKLSHTMWGHPRQMGHDGQVWQNVVYWRREWQTTSVFLPWEAHEQYENAKWYDTGRWAPQVGRYPICYYRRAEQLLIAPERKKGWSQSNNNTHFRMCQVVAARSNAVRKILHRNLECQVHESGQIRSGQTGHGKSESQHSRNQWTEMDRNGLI